MKEFGVIVRCGRRDPQCNGRALICPKLFVRVKAFRVGHWPGLNTVWGVRSLNVSSLLFARMVR